MYYTLIYPYIDYGITLWGSTHKTVINKIVVKQKKAIRIIANAKYNESTNPLFFGHKILKTHDIYKLKLSKYIYAHHKRNLPEPLIKMIDTNSTIHTHMTRNENNPHVERRRTTKASRTIRHLVIGTILQKQ